MPLFNMPILIIVIVLFSLLIMISAVIKMFLRIVRKLDFLSIKHSAELFVKIKKIGSRILCGIVFIIGIVVFLIYNGQDFLELSFFGTQILAKCGVVKAQKALGLLYCINGEEEGLEWIAEHGSAEAQTYLGFIFEKGQLVKQDYAKAASWYTRAANQGDASAQFCLGSFFFKGLGVIQDDRKALELTEQAAQQGLAEAQFKLGSCYDEGKGIARNDQKAFEWYSKAAQQGLAEAQLRLGMQYKIGCVGKPNIEKAAEWYTKAAEQGNDNALLFLSLLKKEIIMKKPIDVIMKEAEQGNREAQHELGRRYSYGEGVEKSEKKAFEWYAKAANQGDEKALVFAMIRSKIAKQSFAELFEKAKNGNAENQRELALRYQVGLGVEKNLQEAAKLYTSAAEQGDAVAQMNLGICYADGIGIEHNDKKAVEWYSKAADQGQVYAQYELGLIYLKGLRGVAKDYKKAVKWIIKAAEKGLVGAQSDLGFCYDHGLGVARDDKKAVEFYMKAAIQGDPTARANLGYCYLIGKGVEKNYTKACMWYSKAAEQGYEPAIEAIKSLHEQEIEKQFIGHPY